MMLAKLSKRWWWILVVWIISIAAVTTVNFSMKPMYTGQTTVMESLGTNPAMQKSHLSNASEIAHRRSVIESVGNTLNKHGYKVSPDDLSRQIHILQIKDTYLLKIQVKASNPKEAKMAADVMASTLRKAYFEEYLADLKLIEPATVLSVNQHKALKLQQTSIFSLIPGIILALCVPLKSKNNCAKGV